MKAYRQFSLKSEHNLVWSYTAALILIGIVLMVRPVFAQDEEPSKPELRVEVQKEYDNNGTLLSLDSVRTWSWSGKEYSMQQFDSLWDNMSQELADLFPPNPGHNGSSLHSFWHWNGQDSSAYSYFNELFDEEFTDSIWDHSTNFHFNDFWNLESPGFNDELFRKQEELDANFEEQLRAIQERLRKYEGEHQELIEKYLNEPWQNEDIDPEAHPKPQFPVPENNNKSRSGEI